MTDASRRITVGYIGCVFPEFVPGEKEAITAWHKEGEPDEWFVDEPESSGDFLRLINLVRSGVVQRIVYKGDRAFPKSPVLIGKLFDAAMETGTEMVAVEQGAPNPMQKLQSQLMPLIFEWSRTEDAHFGMRGWHTIYADTADVLWLREKLEGIDDERARRWLTKLPEFEEDED